jgi:hypothetical protein
MVQSFARFFFMVAEILAAEFVFALPLRRRSYFWARFIGSALICIAATLWIAGIYSLVTDTEMTYGSTDRLGDSIFKIVYYLFVFILTVAGIKFSYNASIWTVLFYCAGGYAAQHMAVNLARLFRLIPALSDFTSSFSLGGYLLELCICAVIYTLSYFLFIRRENAENDDRDVRKKVFLSLCIVSICIGISRLTTDDPTRSVLTCVAEAISAIVNCVLILAILFDVTAKNKAERELEIMTELLHREKEQYRLTKENIDLINIKCHDLKHQIKALRENASEPYIRKIEDAVMFYDAAFKTGNDVLDVILTEKSLFCEQNKICFTCIARGEDLSFMEDMDVYSLFGNALSNAIERVRTIEDENRRCISVNVQTTGRLLSVHIENFYEGEIVFKNGFPVTDRNRDYHGFGMKSMDYIAKRYNGCMSISARDGLFGLDFIFPLPETPETSK